MTKRDFNKLDLAPKRTTLSAIEKGMQEIDRKNKAFKKNYKG